MEVIREDNIKDKIYWLFRYVSNQDLKKLCKILDLKCEMKKFKIIFKALPSYCKPIQLYNSIVETTEIDIRQNDCVDKFTELMQKYFIDDIKFI